MDIQQQKQFKILVLGDNCDDVYHYGTCERLSPEAPVPILKEHKIITKRGMSGNVAENLKSFGFKVHHICNESVIQKHRFVDIKHSQHLFRVDCGENNTLDSVDLESVMSKYPACNIDAIVISDYDKGFLNEYQCQKICQFYKKLPIFVDSKKTDLSCFSGCIIKINEHEKRNITQHPKKSDLVVTLGSKGALYGDKIYKAKEVEVYDVCGAGDVFLSALVYKYLLTKNMDAAIIFSNKCASYSVSKFGTHVLTREEIEDLYI
tara:strand:+ start:1990 stop:2778 length:789 start_codon:yes stop_codon:yes gene_type:complete